MTIARLPSSRVSADVTPKDMGFFEHLAELRKCLLIIIAAVAVGSGIAYGYSDSMFGLLTAPFNTGFAGAKLIGTGPGEAFMLKLQVCVFAGLILSSPVIFHQIWLFVAPGLYQHEQRYVLPFVASMSLLFALGVWFCYYAVLPVALDFFHTQYTSINLQPTIKISELLSVELQALLGFGVIFELPIFAFFLARIGVLNHQMMLNNTRYAIVIIFIIAAVLTPPDVFSQFLMAGPLLILYGISILIVKIFEQKQDVAGGKG